MQWVLWNVLDQCSRKQFRLSSWINHKQAKLRSIDSKLKAGAARKEPCAQRRPPPVDMAPLACVLLHSLHYVEKQAAQSAKKAKAITDTPQRMTATERMAYRDQSITTKWEQCGLGASYTMPLTRTHYSATEVVHNSRIKGIEGAEKNQSTHRTAGREIRAMSPVVHIELRDWVSLNQRRQSSNRLSTLGKTERVNTVS